MLVNNNLNICHTLARRDFKFHKTKNLLLAFAVALITGLYSFAFLLGSSVENAYLLNYEYRYGSTRAPLQPQSLMLPLNRVRVSVRISPPQSQRHFQTIYPPFLWSVESSIVSFPNLSPIFTLLKKSPLSPGAFHHLAPFPNHHENDAKDSTLRHFWFL